MVADSIMTHVWMGKQSWNFQSIEKIRNNSIIRITIKVDSYTFQSNAMVELWCIAQGWKEVHSIPGELMSSMNISYTAKDVTSNQFNCDAEELRRVANSIL